MRRYKLFIVTNGMDNPYASMGTPYGAHAQPVHYGAGQTYGVSPMLPTIMPMPIIERRPLRVTLIIIIACVIIFTLLIWFNFTRVSFARFTENPPVKEKDEFQKGWKMFGRA